MKTLRPTNADIAKYLSTTAIVDTVGRKAIYYKIPEHKPVSSEHIVTRTKKTGEMMCTCEFKSLHPEKEDRHCKHIQAVMIRINNEGEETW